MENIKYFVEAENAEKDVLYYLKSTVDTTKS